jgi:hypothetical protein
MGCCASRVETTSPPTDTGRRQEPHNNNSLPTATPGHVDTGAASAAVNDGTVNDVAVRPVNDMAVNGASAKSMDQQVHRDDALQARDNASSATTPPQPDVPALSPYEMACRAYKQACGIEVRASCGQHIGR